MAALAAKTLFQAALSFLIRILDYALPIAMQLARLPLFIARILGDGVIATLKGIVRFLWLPVSFGAATAIQAVLLAKAASLPAWMQLLHPLATFVAKSTLLALPAYPAAWPQAKKHPFIQAIARGYRDFESLNVVQKTGYRYRQTECATQKIVDVIGRVASIVGLRYLCNTLLGWLNGTVAWIGKASRDAMRNNVEELSRVWLIGSIVRNYAARYSGDKPSERELRVFERWSIRFSAVYYEAKEREKETKGHTSAQG